MKVCKNEKRGVAMKPRQSNLELMRLVAMLFIVAHHFAVHSGFFFRGTRITGNMMFLQLLTILGKVGVNLFVMLSAWFLLDAPKLRTSKVVRLWRELLRGTAYVDSPWLIPYCLACTAGVYCVCALIEALRLRLLDGAIQRIAERAEKRAL